MVAGFSGIEVEAGVNSFEVVGDYFSGNAGTGIVVAAGASDRYVIAHNILDGSATLLSDSGTGTKYLAGNLP